MLSALEIRTVAGAVLTLPLDDVTDGIIVEDVDGLEPVKATLVSSSFAQMDGEEFQSSSRTPRNIKIRFGMEPNFVSDSVRSIRNRIYSFLMPKTQVFLRFYDSDGLEVDISGYVETCEAPMFVQEPKLDASIMCFKPDLIDITPVEIEGETVSDADETLIEYEGSVPTGLELVLNIDRTLAEFTVYHRGPDNVIRSLDFAGALENGDILTLNTNPGSKGASLNRLSTISSVLYGVSPQAFWTTLMPGGDNYIRVYAEGDPIPFTITYTTKYGAL